MRPKNTNIDLFFKDASTKNSIILFESKRTKSLFSLLYLLYLVGNRKKVLYISEFDVITDLEKLYNDYPICKTWTSQIKKDELTDHIIISSDISSINKIVDSPTFERVIFDEISMDHTLTNSEINTIKNAGIAIDILKTDTVNSSCELCNYKLTGKCISHPGMLHMDACSRVEYFEKNPQWIFQKKSKRFSVHCTDMHTGIESKSETQHIKI